MRLPLLFIFATIVIDAMGIGLILPVMPDLLREVSGGDLASAAVWGGVLATAFAVMQFLVGPTVGNLSDRFGRRPILLVALGALALDYMVMALAGTIWLLLAGRIVGGITASTQSTAMAYMADISKPEEKAKNFGLVGAAFGIGFVLGPLIGGLLGGWGTRAPFWAAAALAAVNLGFGLIVMPETVTARIDRRPFDWRRANPLGAFRAIAGLPGLRPMLWLIFLYGVASFVYPAIWAFYGAAQFGWGPGMIGLSLAVFGLSMAVVQGALVGPVIARIGERRAVIGGLWIEIASLVGLAFATSGSVALVVTVLSALSAVAGPAIQAILSRTAADDQQGELQGILAAINAVAVIVSPLLMTTVFAAFTAPGAAVHLPGAPFLLAAVLVAGCVWLFALRQDVPPSSARPLPREPDIVA